MEKVFAKYPGWILLAALGLCVLTTASSWADDQYEEIAVTFEVPRLVSKDLFVRFDGKTVYLPVIEVFNLLELSIQADLSTKRYFGYVFDKKAGFEINLDSKVMKAHGKEIPLLAGDCVQGEFDLYLRIDLFETLFDLKMTFDYSRLGVSLPLNKDFPSYQRMLRKQAHDKLLAKTVAQKDVYQIPKKREYFSGGVADWLVSTTPLGGRKTYDYNLTLGGMLMGGDLDVTGGGDTRTGFDQHQLNYLWHYYFGTSKYITQAELGHVFGGGILSRSLEGGFLTNRPQVRRKHFQTVDLTGTLGEGWEVELYVDNKLIDFMRTDQNGEYHFNVDVLYGSSLITLKMYGPNGEFTTREEQIRVPYNMIPKGEVEYTATAGKGSTSIDDGTYAQASCYYGILDKLTAGINSDFPIQTKINPQPTIAGELAFQPLTSLTIGGYVAPGYAAYGGLNYSQFTFINVDGGYTRYFSTRFRNRLGQIDNILLSVSSPLRLGKRNLGLRFYGSLDRFKDYTFTNFSYGFSTTLMHMNINYIGGYKISAYTYSNRATKSMTSQLLISPQFIRWLRPQVRLDYDHEEKNISRYGVYLNKRIFRTGQISLSYEHNELAQSSVFMVSVNLFTQFAALTTRGLTSSNQVAISQVQRGSVRYDEESKSVHFDNRNGVGFASALLRPFKDNNFNGVFDENDEYIPGLKAQIQGASGRPVGRERTYYYDRLRPYDEYLVEIDPYSLDNPLLKPTHENYRVYFSPNRITAIDVPVVTAGEINGQVQRQTALGKSGLGGVKIEVTDLARGIKTEIVTFNNGEFYYLGLIPGKYRAEISREQLKNYGYISDPPFIDFEIKPAENGSVVNNINFALIPQN